MRTTTMAGGRATQPTLQTKVAKLIEEYRCGNAEHFFRFVAGQIGAADPREQHKNYKGEGPLDPKYRRKINELYAELPPEVQDGSSDE